MEPNLLRITFINGDQLILARFGESSPPDRNYSIIMGFELSFTKEKKLKVREDVRITVELCNVLYYREISVNDAIKEKHLF